MKSTAESTIPLLIAVLVVVQALVLAALAADFMFGEDLAPSQWNVVAFPFKRPISTTVVDANTMIGLLE